MFQLEEMMTDYIEFNQRIQAWEKTGDERRLRLLELYDEAYRYRESQPEYQYWVLSQARIEALALEEPWWAFLFDGLRLSTLTADLHDFSRALPLALELMPLLNHPDYRDHPNGISVQTSYLYTLLQIDPVGYQNELDEGFSVLDNLIPQGSTSDRMVMNYRKTELLCQTRRWQVAYDHAQRFLVLADESETENWWQCWALFLLCPICFELGLSRELQNHADDMAYKSEFGEHLIRTKASGLLWRAIAYHLRGKKQLAGQSYQMGMQSLARINARDEICAEPEAKYHELSQDWNSALIVRERELAAIQKKGMLHRNCIIEMERCRYLGCAGKLTHHDLDTAQEAAFKLKSPNWYMEKLKEIASRNEITLNIKAFSVHH